MNLLLPLVLLFLPHVGVKQEVSSSWKLTAYYIGFNFILFLALNHIIPFDTAILESVNFKHLTFLYLGILIKMILLGGITYSLLKRKQYFNINLIQILNIFLVTMFPFIIPSLLPFHDGFIRFLSFLWEVILIVFLLKNTGNIPLKKSTASILIAWLILFILIIPFTGIRLNSLF